VEIFRIRTEEEVKKKMERRRKRAKEKKEHDKSKKQAKDMPGQAVTELAIELTEPQLVDYFTPHVVVRAGGKVRSFDIDPSESNLRGGFKVWIYASM
jgi:U3 small nucleolar RNA-associated protein 12